MGDAARAACPSRRGQETESTVLTLKDWKALGKPPNLDEYLKAAARAEAGERREFQRYEATLRVRLSRVPSWRNEAIQFEDTQTEVIARGGALVRSRMAVESGEVVVFELGSYKTRAEVRYVSGGAGAAEDFQRLGLRFLDTLMPDELIPADAKPL
jgi:hypothetical protein